MPILPADPKGSYTAHRDEILGAVQRVLESGWYILGEETRAFEREFAAWMGTSHAIGVASGTDALQLALRALGVGPGDAVLTVSHTAVATVAAIELVGATPVLVDIEAGSYTMSPSSLEATLDAKGNELRFKAVVPVHLYGQPAAMDTICRIAAERDLLVLEDCAQAHGATMQGRGVGTWGNVAAFSFYPTKNLGAFGDGGAVTTADAAMAERLRALREYGWRERYVSDEPGLNSRLDELQSAILRVKLRYLNQDNERRRRVAAEYDRALAATSLVLPSPLADNPARLPPVRDPVLAAGRIAFVSRRSRHPDDSALSAARAPSARLSRPRADCAGRTACDGIDMRADSQPADAPVPLG